MRQGIGINGCSQRCRILNICLRLAVLKIFTFHLLLAWVVAPEIVRKTKIGDNLQKTEKKLIFLEMAPWLEWIVQSPIYFCESKGIHQQIQILTQNYLIIVDIIMRLIHQNMSLNYSRIVKPFWASHLIDSFDQTPFRYRRQKSETFEIQRIYPGKTCCLASTQGEKEKTLHNQSPGKEWIGRLLKFPAEPHIKSNHHQNRPSDEWSQIVQNEAGFSTFALFDAIQALLNISYLRYGLVIPMMHFWIATAIFNSGTEKICTCAARFIIII